MDKLPFGIKKIDFLIQLKLVVSNTHITKKMSSVSVSKCFSPNSKAARRSGNYQKSMEASKHFTEKNTVPKKKTSPDVILIKKYKVTTVSPSGNVSRYNIFAKDDEQMNGYFYQAEKNGDKYFSVSFFHPLMNKKKDVYNISLQDGWRYSQTLKKVVGSDNNAEWKDVREFYGDSRPNSSPSASTEIPRSGGQEEYPGLCEEDFPKLPMGEPKSDGGVDKEVSEFIALPDDEFPEI